MAYKIRLKVIAAKSPQYELRHRCKVSGDLVTFYQRNREGQPRKAADEFVLETEDRVLAKRLLGTGRFEQVHANDLLDEPEDDEPEDDEPEDDEPEDDAPKLRAQLAQKKIVALRALAKKHGVSSRGTKQDIIDRLVSVTLEE